MQDRLPKEEGQYYWSEWDKVVKVYERGNHGNLYVRVFPHWPPVKITPRIAGKFTKVGTDGH